MNVLIDELVYHMEQVKLLKEMIRLGKITDLVGGTHEAYIVTPEPYRSTNYKILRREWPQAYAQVVSTKPQLSQVRLRLLAQKAIPPGDYSPLEVQRILALDVNLGRKATENEIHEWLGRT